MSVAVTLVGRHKNSFLLFLLLSVYNFQSKNENVREYHIIIKLQASIHWKLSPILLNSH